MENINAKTCENCKFYARHYTKRNTKYSAVNCGYCLNRNSKKKKPLESCEFWEDEAVIKEERKKSINETLEFMAKRLDEIATVLKDETE